MADLIVSFGRFIREAPIAAGDDVRTEVITIGASSVSTTIAANSRDRLAHLEAGANCWVAIGVDPDAEPSTAGGDPIWPMNSGAEKDFYVQPGFKVAVIQR